MAAITLPEFIRKWMASTLRECESGFRYTSTTTFETFPFPWPYGLSDQEILERLLSLNLSRGAA
jgi:hypothetical protein